MLTPNERGDRLSVYSVLISKANKKSLVNNLKTKYDINNLDKEFARIIHSRRLTLQKRSDQLLVLILGYEINTDYKSVYIIDRLVKFLDDDEHEDALTSVERNQLRTYLIRSTNRKMSNINKI